MVRSEAIGTSKSGLSIAIRLTPKAKTSAIHSEIIEGQAGPAIRASVTAPPVDGAANAALIALLAKTWKVPKTSLEVVGGARTRNKVVLARGDPVEVRRILTRWLGEHGEG